jgi:hypothetical protein
MTYLKDLQSIGRGIRNDEMTVVMASKPTVLDYVTDGILPEFKPGYMRNFTHDHWCHDAATDKWTFHKGRPYHEYIAGSDKIIARNTEGVFYWYKIRSGEPTPRNLNEAELKDLLFVILGAEEVVKNGEWIDISKLRAAGW